MDNMIITGEHFLDLVKKNKKLSEIIIPELMHRLIKETIAIDTYTHFPSEDDVFAPGFDGIVLKNSTLHRFLPVGNLYYEIGTKKDCCKGIAKIDSDYQKRKNDDSIKDKNEFTYIAITTCILDSKKKQIKCNEYIKENIFKSVLILDAIDITSWMEEHINVCIWFLQKYGEKIDDYDIVLVSDEWDRISKATTPQLSCDLFIAGNERNSEKLIQDLIATQTNKVFTISSEHYGRDFAYAFFISSLIKSNSAELIERSIAVNSQSGMNYINAFCKGKVVLVNFNCLDDRFANDLNNTYIFFDTLFDADIKLDMIQQRMFVKEIIKLGYSDSEASRISFVADYNALALRRLLAKMPSVRIPIWSRKHEKTELIPLLLMGEINMDKTGDLIFLKSIIGDDIDSYTEKLNLWSEMNQSPILKFENLYRICSRKECFDFLQIDIFSLKLKAIEDQMISALSEVNQKYTKDKDEWLFNDGSYKRSDRLINNIIDGFILLSNKNQKHQAHFDLFVGKIFDNIYGNFELSLTISHHFRKLCELSPQAYLSYLRKSIFTDEENFEKIIKAKLPGLLQNYSFINYILFALEYVLCVKDCALIGFKTLLDMYYTFPDDETILDEVIKYLSPIATMTSLINMPYFKKIDFFFMYIENKDYNKTVKIVGKLYENDGESIMVGDSPSYRKYDEKEILVTYSEIVETKNKAFNWLMENEKDSNELIRTIKSVLHNIHRIPFEDANNQLNTIKVKLINEDDETKAKVYREVLETREKIIKYNKWETLECYIPVFDDFLKEIKPVDDYIYSRSILVDDGYPLLNPPSTEDDDWYEKTDQLRQQVKKEQIENLIERHGQSVIQKIIKDCTNSSLTIRNLVYEFSENHIDDFKTILECKLSTGLKCYLGLMNDAEINYILENYESDDLVLQSLPCSKKIYTWIDGKEKEKKYWENQYFDPNNADDFEYLFEKFLIFAPEKLVTICSYFIEVDYEHCIKLLNAISEIVNSKSNEELIYEEIFSIQDFVNQMDQKYYTDELSLCEFKLLSILKSGIEDYPMGIKKYFRDHPQELGKLLVQLHEKKDSLPSESLGHKILFEAILSFGGGCYIPNEYIVQKKSEIKSWVNGVLSAAINKEAKKLLKRAIINTLAASPKFVTSEVWPITEVADILESLAKEDFCNSFDVSRIFSSRYRNRRGLRNVNDGTLEFSLSEEFEKYKAYYQFSHPVTSKALEYISSGYNYEAKADRKRAYLGEE